MKVLVNLTDFHTLLWTGRGQNTVYPWQLYVESHWFLSLWKRSHRLKFIFI